MATIWSAIASKDPKQLEALIKAGGDVNPQLPFNYFCYGAALSEVEIDCLTGDMQLRRTDLCTVAFACQ